MSKNRANMTEVGSRMRMTHRLASSRLVQEIYNPWEIGREGDGLQWSFFSATPCQQQELEWKQSCSWPAPVVAHIQQNVRTWTRKSAPLTPRLASRSSRSFCQSVRSVAVGGMQPAFLTLSMSLHEERTDATHGPRPRTDGRRHFQCQLTRSRLPPPPP